MSSAIQRKNVIGVLSTYMGVATERLERRSTSILVDMANLLVALTPPPSIDRHVAHQVQFESLRQLLNSIHHELDLPAATNVRESISAAFGSDAFAVIEGHFAASGTYGIGEHIADFISAH